MVSKILKKYHKPTQKKIMLRTIISALSISEEQKQLYLDALQVIENDALDNLYDEITTFSNDIELKEIEDIRKQNFTNIQGMTRKEAEEKKQDINAFSFLLHNL
ncbi:hypothetical protein OAN96_00195 [Candidatus Gracilibacteria bacterium]|nr:hypothetical protein [Candidatus Gracilibacteria bacterium]